MDDEIRALANKIELDKYELARLLLNFKNKQPCSFGKLKKWIDKTIKE